ncbi:MAG TPA: T9SS type A sorting domain-containing protein [Candidatus Kapabacteria bacterium]|nr:T9SS type A sorting domain-containing protein [Candidatus Kapabacteria bacterium]
MLRWLFARPDANPVLYRLQIATAADFAIGSILLDDATIDTTFYSFTPLNNSTTYYWRVLVNHLTCFSAWSSAWNFKTEFDGPNQIYPTNNTTCIPIETTFEWTQVADAKKYRLQIANGLNFENTIILNTPNIDTIVKVVILPNGMTDYWWRVRAEDSSSTGLWSNIRKFTTTIKAPVLASPANHTGSVKKDSILLLSWNASVPDSLQPQTYTLQISKDDSTFAPANLVVNQTNMYALAYNFVPADYSANYYWRVQTNYDVCTSAWSKFWHFKTIYGKPILLNPLNNEECVQLAAKFHWTTIPNAIAYKIQISDTSSFTNIVREVGNIRADSALVNLQKGVKWYYWRVRGDDNTSVGIWSDSMKFKTTVDNPILIAPVNNANYLPLSNELKWKVTSPADSFLVQVTIKNNFHPDSLLFELLVPNPTNEFMSVNINTTLYNTRYWWRVKVLNDQPECGSQWSETWSFRTMYPQAILISPLNLSTCLPITSEYKWHKVANATKYRLQISDSSDFSNILVNVGDIRDTSYTAIAPLGYTKLYWRVRADDDVNIGIWSNPWSYTSAVMDPTAIFPVNGQENLPLQFMLQWKDESPNAVYHLQVSKYQNFTDILIDVNNLNNNYYHITLPEYHRNYYWRVIAKINNCSSAWSDVWTFNTSLQPPNLIYPENHSENLPLSVIFLWELKEQADSYNFNLSTDSTFASSSIVIAISGILTPQCAVTNLIANTKYFWRVNAESSLGTSIWSDVYSFRTAVLGPDVPYLYLPENGSEKLPIDTTLQWLAAPRAVSYDLQVSLNSYFTDNIIDETGLTGLEYTLNDLMYDQTYYWRVRAQNDSGKTKWSYVWVFTTIQLAPDAKPVLWTPDNSVTNAPISLIFSWYAVNRAVGYQIQIATQADFAGNSIIIDDQPIYVTSRIVAGFEYDKKYYWRVRSFNNGGYGPWADPYNFTTIPDPASVDEEFANSLNLSIAPNPMFENAELSFFMQNNGFASINLINILGQVVQNISNKELFQGMQRFTIDARMLQSGTYFIAIEIGNKKIVKPIVLDK